jgi:PEP-CTERM motif-containing protein
MRQLFGIALLVLSLAGWGSDASADVCNLTTRYSTCGGVSYGDAIFTNTYATGTYYIDAFLQIKNSGTEEGYNTGGDSDTSSRGRKDYQFDQMGTTQNLLLSEIPTVTIDGTEYREFLLRIDEGGSDPMLSLDQLQIFLSPTANLTNYNTTSRTLSGLTAIYDLDSGGNNYIKLNYSLSPYGIAVAYIPNSLFTQSSGTQYVYLYSQFGSNNLAGAGMEEWWVRTDSSGRSVQIVPEPTTLFLFGTALIATAARLRRRFR